jgi:hypothetical protein
LILSILLDKKRKSDKRSRHARVYRKNNVSSKNSGEAGSFFEEDSGCVRRISIGRGGVFGAMTDVIDSIVEELSNAPIRVLFRGC